MPQNTDDYAVVIGIKDYPAFDSNNPLKGPENDAEAFYEWLTDENGGDVPPQNITLVVSKNYNPPFLDELAARPFMQDVHSAFENLQKIAEENEKAEIGYRVGRRLYVYMSGHGFAPTFEETGLLMANATSERAGPAYHILGRYTADWFFRARCFEEVFLFMDCCRDVIPVEGFNKSFKQRNRPGAIAHVKRFYGLATMWSGLAKEKDIDNKRRGVFTDILIKGLKGAAVNPETGNLTSASLKDFILTAMDKTDGDPQLTDPSLSPEISFYPEIKGGFVIKQTQVPEFPIKINAPAAAVGKPARVISGIDLKTVVKSTDSVPAVWEIELKRGKYLVQFPAIDFQPIEVIGTGGLDVSF